MKSHFVIDVGFETAAARNVAQAAKDLSWREHVESSDSLKKKLDGVRIPLPCANFSGELTSAGGGELVEFCAPVVLRRSPFGVEPPLVLEPVERGVERSLIDL
jgi:hypothetical protein